MNMIASDGDALQIRNDTSSNWSSANPILENGEVAFETDTKKMKVGNGTSNWSNLSYIKSDMSELANYLPLSGGVFTNNSQIMRSGAEGQTTLTIFGIKDNFKCSSLFLSDEGHNYPCFMLRAGDGTTTTQDLKGYPNGSLSWNNYPLTSFYFATFTSGNMTSSQYDCTINFTTPTGYTAMPIKCRTNGWVGSPYIGAWSNSNAQMFWTHSGAGTVSVDVMFYKRFE